MTQNLSERFLSVHSFVFLIRKTLRSFKKNGQSTIWTDRIAASGESTEIRFQQIATPQFIRRFHATQTQQYSSHFVAGQGNHQTAANDNKKNARHQTCVLRVLSQFDLVAKLPDSELHWISKDLKKARQGNLSSCCVKYLFGNKPSSCHVLSFQIYFSFWKRAGVQNGDKRT